MKLKDLCVLPDVETFLDVFDDDEVADMLERKVAELVDHYNGDNLEEERRLEDWLAHDKVFPLAEKRFDAPRPPAIGPYKDRWQQQSSTPDGGGATAASAAAAAASAAASAGASDSKKREVSRLYGMLSTFDATLRRKRGDVVAEPLRPEEIEFQLKMASSVFNAHPSAGGGATDDGPTSRVSALPDNVRFDKNGFGYPALEFVNMLRSKRFADFLVELKRGFAKHLPSYMTEDLEEEEEGTLKQSPPSRAPTPPAAQNDDDDDELRDLPDLEDPLEQSQHKTVEEREALSARLT